MKPNRPKKARQVVKVKPIQVWLDPKLWTRVKSAVPPLGLTLSEFVAEAIQEKLLRQRETDGAAA